MKTVNKKSIIIGVVGIAVAVALVGIYFMSDNKQTATPAPTPLPVLESVAKHLMSYKDGVVSLYNVEQSKLVDSFDLNSMSKVKNVNQVTGAIPSVKATPTPEPVPTITKPETYQKYLKVPVTVKKGDTSWAIQSFLTPSENIVDMLKLVSKFNKSLHPIYPGDKMTFLKEADGAEKSPAVKKPMVDQVKSPAVKKDTPLPSKSTNTVDKYIYFGSIEKSALYVYSNVDHAIYLVSGKNEKIEVSKIVQNESLSIADHLYVLDGKAFLTNQNSQSVTWLGIEEGLKIEVIDLEGIPTTLTTKGNDLFYTYSNRLGKMDLQSKTKENVMMGDESKDITITNNTLYVLNAFGSKSNYSMLIQVNPDDLKVSNMLNLETKESAILSKGDKDELSVGRVMTSKSNTGDVVKTTSASLITQKGLKMSIEKWNIPFPKESFGYQSHLYVLDSGHVKIFEINNEIPLKDIEIKGDHFAVLP
jgi:hypothetical protein